MWQRKRSELLKISQDVFKTTLPCRCSKLKKLRPFWSHGKHKPPTYDLERKFRCVDIIFFGCSPWFYSNTTVLKTKSTGVSDYTYDNKPLPLRQLIVYDAPALPDRLSNNPVFKDDLPMSCSSPPHYQHLHLLRCTIVRCGYVLHCETLVVICAYYHIRSSFLTTVLFSGWQWFLSDNCPVEWNLDDYAFPR